MKILCGALCNLREPLSNYFKPIINATQNSKIYYTEKKREDTEVHREKNRDTLWRSV